MTPANRRDLLNLTLSKPVGTADRPIWHCEYGLGNAERMQAVEMRLKGYTNREVAEVFNVEPGTVWLWMKRWQQAQDRKLTTHPNYPKR